MGKASAFERKHGAGRPSAREAEARLEKMLEVAARVFLEKGYQGASVSEIAARANASKQTIYRRYRTKQELFSAVIRRRSEGGFAVLEGAIGSEVEITAALRQFAMILIFPFTDKETLRLLRSIIGNAEEIPEPAIAFWTTGPARVHKLVIEMMRRGMDRGELKRSKPDDAMRLFLALCTGWFWSQSLLLANRRIGKKETEAYYDHVLDAFMKVYGSESQG